MLATQVIHIGSQAVMVERATTDEQKQAGLSGRESLPDGAGMLFVFTSALQEGFWMKDMRFSLDIIWADAEGTIVTIDQNISPATYPNVFRPTAPAQYVLELPAGYAAKHGIAVGQKIVL